MDAQRHREIERVHLFYIIISLFLCLYIYIVYYIISIFHVNCGITIITRWWAGAPSNGSTRHSRPPGLFLFHLFFYDFCFSLISFTKQDCMFVISQCAMCVSSLFHVSHFCRRFDFLVFVSVFCSCCDSDESKKKKKKTSIQSHCIRVIYFFCFSSICCSFIHFAGCTLWRLTFLSVCFDVFGSDVMSASHCYLFAAIGCCFFFLHSATTTTCRTTFLFTENNTHRKNLFALRM